MDPIRHRDLKHWRKIVTAFALGLLLLWIAFRFRQLTDSGWRLLHFCIGVLFVYLIMSRRHRGARIWVRSSRRIVVIGAGGALLYLLGLAIRGDPFQWIGLLLVVYACLTWSLPAGYHPHLVRALFLFYWIHPLPTRIFEKLQLVMQKLSVVGGEGVAHILNLRVWADGIIIRAGYHDFEIPAASSGMQTATTIMLCALGAGFYYRWRPRPIIALILLGLTQVLVLNIARIATMLTVAANKPLEWSSTFLHDTTGSFFLTAILLLYVEIMFVNWCMLQRKHIRSGMDRSVDVAQIRQNRHDGRQRTSWTGIGVLVAIIVLLGMAGAIYKHRPTHRAAMIAGTVEGLLARDLSAAEGAARVAIRLHPTHSAHQMLCAHALLTQGKYTAGLELLDQVPLDFRGLEYTAMRVQGLFAANREAECQSVVDDLPTVQRRYPGIAITAAELATRQDDPDAVVENLHNAIRAGHLVERVRGHYRYLARHKRWKSIADIDTGAPFVDADTLRIAVTAHLLLNNTHRAEKILRANEGLWEKDLRFITHLQALALRRPHGQWANIYTHIVLDRLADWPFDELLDTIEPMFALYRPNVAWTLYNRIVKEAPDHPGVHFIAARFAHQWFTFYRSAIDVASAGLGETVDLRAEAAILGSYDAIDPLPDPIPLANDLVDANIDAFVSDRMTRSFAAFERWSEKDAGFYRTEMMRGEALTMGGHYAQAHAVIDRIDHEYPERRIEVLICRVRLFDLEENWGQTYGSIKELYDLDRFPLASLNVVLINALLQLDLAVYAMEVARESIRAFPDSVQMKLSLAATWKALGFDEDALFIARKYPVDQPSPAIARLIEAAGRLSDTANMSRTVAIDPAPEKSLRSMRLPAAERAVIWPERHTPSPGETAEIVDQLRDKAAAANHPYRRALYCLKLEWHTTGGQGASGEPDTWAAIGADSFEKSSALHKLGMLHARSGDFARAGEAIDRALDLTPRSPILWRQRVATSGGEVSIVRQARLHCADDPELFLAHLVVGLREPLAGIDVHGDLLRAAKAGSFSAGTIIRAADMLFRHDQPGIALEAVQSVVRQNENYLPAYLLGIRAATAARDKETAYRFAIRAADLSTNPWPLRKIIVRLKMSSEAFDLDLTQRLRRLVAAFPAEPEWSERLGRVLFEQGALEDARRVYTQHVSRHDKPMKAGSYVRAGESARTAGHAGDALKILRTGQVHYPDDLHIANNLLYTMAVAGVDMGDANQRIERLLALGESAAVYDTVAIVYHVTGQRAEAQRYLAKAIATVSPDADEWEEIMTNGAEMYFAWGDTARAKEITANLLKRPAKHELNRQRLRRLIARIQSNDRPQPAPAQ